MEFSYHFQPLEMIARKPCRKLTSKFDCVDFLLLSSRNTMECSGSQDAKELVRSPPSGQARGERSGQRPSRPLRLGGLSFEPVCAAENAVRRVPSTFVLSLSLSPCLRDAPLMGLVHLWLTFSFPATENPAELRPKNTLGGQLNESMFLLR